MATRTGVKWSARERAYRAARKKHGFRFTGYFNSISDAESAANEMKELLAPMDIHQVLGIYEFGADSALPLQPHWVTEGKDGPDALPAAAVNQLVIA